MADYHENHRNAADLTAEARASAEAAADGYRLERFLPARDNDSLEYNFDLNVLGLTDVAEFRAFDTTPGYGEGQAGSASRRGSLPPVSRQYRVKEYEQLQLQIGGEERIGLKLDEYARKGGLAIAARVGLAQAEAIEFDRVRLQENGLDVEIKYGRDPRLFTAATVLWNDPNANVLEELLSWLNTYRILNGGANPGTTLISQRILDALSMNKQIIASTFGKATTDASLPNRIQFADVTAYLSAWGVRNIEVFTGNIDRKALLSDHKVIFLPEEGSSLDGAGALGTTEWGITAESIQPMYGIGAGERSGIFAAAFDSNRPQGTDVLSTAVVIPALVNSNAVMTVAVLPPAAS
jgi:hypothetical protein